MLQLIFLVSLIKFWFFLWNPVVWIAPRSGAWAGEMRNLDHVGHALHKNRGSIAHVGADGHRHSCDLTQLPFDLVSDDHMMLPTERG